MCKIIQLISNFLYKKTCFLLCNYMFIRSNWQKKNHMKNLKNSWNFELKGYKENN
jgi:hypothetical protein